MGESFGKLLHACRKMAKPKLSQRRLGQLIGIDGSMISRFETAPNPPSLAIVQKIISTLANKSVPQEKLDELWRSASRFHAQIAQTAETEPIVSFMRQSFEKLEQDEKATLIQELQSVIEINQGLVSAIKMSRRRRWKQATEELLSLREQVERRVQNRYLQIDEELGRSLYSDGHYSNARQYYESALLIARQLGNDRKQAETLIRLGDIHRRRGAEDWEIALARYNEALEVFEKQNDKIRVADCKRKIAGVYLFQGRPDKALPLLEESLTVCQEKNHNRGVYKALQHKAWANDMLGRWREATRLNEEALALLKQAGSDEWELAKGLRYLGDSYRLQRRIPEAEETYKAALDILRESKKTGVGDRILSGMILLRLGKVYLKLPGRELEAKSCLNESLRVLTDLGEDFGIAEALTEQGDLLLTLGRFYEAEIRLKQARDRLMRSGNVICNVIYYAIVLALLCELYYGKREFSAIYPLSETAEKADNGLIDYQLARINFTVGRALVAERQFAKGFDALCKASEKALHFNDECFREFEDEFVAEIDRIGREIGHEVALQLCDAYQEFWKSKKVEALKQDLVRESLEAIRQKRQELEALAPIS